MDGLRIVKQLLRNLAVAVVLSVAVMGALGYLLAGWNGLINLAAWGVALGLIGGFSTGLALLIETKYWSGYAGRYAGWWLMRETEGDKARSGEHEDGEG